VLAAVAAHQGTGAEPRVAAGVRGVDDGGDGGEGAWGGVPDDVQAQRPQASLHGSKLLALVQFDGCFDGVTSFRG